MQFVPLYLDQQQQALSASNCKFSSNAITNTHKHRWVSTTLCLQFFPQPIVIAAALVPKTISLLLGHTKKKHIEAENCSKHTPSTIHPNSLALRRHSAARQPSNLQCSSREWRLIGLHLCTRSLRSRRTVGIRCRCVADAQIGCASYQFSHMPHTNVCVCV